MGWFLNREMPCELKFVVYSIALLKPTLPLYRLAYRSGVTSAITPPSSSGLLSGLSTVFSTGSSHALEQGAVLKPVTALHVGISMNGEKSVATQVGALRRILLSGLKEETQSEEGELGAVVRKVLDVNSFAFSLTPANLLVSHRAHSP